MESPAGISFSLLKALISPQQHLSMLEGKANEFQRGKGAEYKRQTLFPGWLFWSICFPLSTLQYSLLESWQTVSLQHFLKTPVFSTLQLLSPAWLSRAKGKCQLCFSFFPSQALHWEGSPSSPCSPSIPPAFPPPDSSKTFPVVLTRPRLGTNSQGQYLCVFLRLCALNASKSSSFKLLYPVAAGFFLQHHSICRQPTQ